MLPVVNIFNIKLSTYSLVGILAYILYFIFTIYFAKKHRINMKYILCCFVFETIGILTGAKIYYILLNLGNYTEIFNASIEDSISLLLSGFYFTGAIIRQYYCTFHLF